MVSAHFLNTKVEKNVFNAILQSEILAKFHPKYEFFKYLTFNLGCLSQK